MYILAYILPWSFSFFYTWLIPFMCLPSFLATQLIKHFGLKYKVLTSIWTGIAVFIDFSQEMEVTVMALNHGGDPLGSILGPMGSHWVKQMGQTVENYHAPKFEFSTTPGVIDFSQKMEVTVMAPNHGGDPLGSILGPMGSHWVQKMGQNRKKLPCPKIRIFDYPAVIDF